MKESMLFSFKKKQEQFIKKKTRLGRRRTSAVGRVPTNYNFLKLNKMENVTKIESVVKSVRVSNVNGTPEVSFTVSDEFDGFERIVDHNTGAISFVRQNVNHFRMTVAQLVRCADLHLPLYSYYFAGINPYEIEQKTMRDLFLGAKITFERTFVPANTEYVDKSGNKMVTKGDKFDTVIVNVEMNSLNVAVCTDEPRTLEMINAAVRAAN